jgi:exonuclease III
MKIVTWNINGIKARIGNLLVWLRDSQPDIVCLQEIKSVDDQFPRIEIEALGYNVETHGQKGFNGVAILSIPVRRGQSRPARRKRRRAGALHRGRVLDGKRRVAGRLALSAERQSDRHGEIFLQTGLDGEARAMGR